jgi:membrane peptidoglycan carboxypeptidase
MATLAAGGLRATTHFVARVEKDHAAYYPEPTGTVRALEAGVVADVTAVLAAQPDGQIPGGPPTAGVAGTALIAGSALDAAHAWYVGYTPALAVAVWVGNQEVEFPLRDAVGKRITGETLPAEIYRAIVSGATGVLDPPAAQFLPPANLGDASVGDAPAGPAA